MFRSLLTRNIKCRNASMQAVPALRKFPQLRRLLSSSDSKQGTAEDAIKQVRAARKAKAEELRAAAAAASAAGSGASNRSSTAAVAITAAVLGVTAYASFDIRNNPTGALNQLYAGSIIEQAVDAFYSSVIEPFEELFLPHKGSTLPAWNDDPYYAQAGIPPGTPAPPLLVIDVEKTLVAFTYDSMNGKRFVKRPGADKFIKSLFWAFGYFEIALISENDVGAMMEIFQALDPDGMCFYLGNSASELRGDKYLKRLDNLNRDPRRIILIDDSAETSQLYPSNTIIVPPFVDIHAHDTVLEELIPFLQALCHEAVNDLPALLDELGTHEAEEVVTEYRMRLQEKKMAERRKRDRGLGGLIRGSAAAADSSLLERKSAILSPADIVGSHSATAADSAINSSSSSGAVLTHEIKLNGQVVAGKSVATKKGPVNRKEGKLMQLLKEKVQNKAEEDEIKMKKMQEAQERKIKEKHERDLQRN